MKITDLEIDGFGVWHNLKLTNLSPRLTSFYGANEAGKTTVMQFVRSVLYGVTPGRRKRYLPPVDGGQPGGALGIADGELRFRASRIADRGPDDVGRVICTASDGATGGDRLLREALADVDEVTYSNVFAVSLDEIQELNMLSGTKAGEWIYRLTSGLDRVSLYDVIQELGANREALLSDRGQSSQIV
ncbi:MAG TPA: AAA family ATPase, partial [Lacipirellula sp.]